MVGGGFSYFGWLGFFWVQLRLVFIICRYTSFKLNLLGINHRFGIGDDTKDLKERAKTMQWLVFSKSFKD